MYWERTQAKNMDRSKVFLVFASFFFFHQFSWLTVHQTAQTDFDVLYGEHFTRQVVGGRGGGGASRKEVEWNEGVKTYRRIAQMTNVYR